MPFPIIWAVGAAVVAAAGATYAYFKDDEDNANESSASENKKFEYGSTIIIGPQQSGKTHLAKWLVNEKLLDSYIPTTNKVEIGEFTDIRGGEIQVNDWENLIREKKNFLIWKNL